MNTKACAKGFTTDCRFAMGMLLNQELLAPILIDLEPLNTHENDVFQRPKFKLQLIFENQPFKQAGILQYDGQRHPAIAK